MKKKIAIITAVDCALTISGFSALWNYASDDPREAKLLLRYEIEDFYYPEGRSRKQGKQRVS